MSVLNESAILESSDVMPAGSRQVEPPSTQAPVAEVAGASTTGAAAPAPEVQLKLAVLPAMPPTEPPSAEGTTEAEPLAAIPPSWLASLPALQPVPIGPPPQPESPAPPAAEQARLPSLPQPAVEQEAELLVLRATNGSLGITMPGLAAQPSASGLLPLAETLPVSVQLQSPLVEGQPISVANATSPAAKEPTPAMTPTVEAGAAAVAAGAAPPRAPPPPDPAAEPTTAAAAPTPLPQAQAALGAPAPKLEVVALTSSPEAEIPASEAAASLQAAIQAAEVAGAQPFPPQNLSSSLAGITPQLAALAASQSTQQGGAPSAELGPPPEQLPATYLPPPVPAIPLVSPAPPATAAAPTGEVSPRQHLLPCEATMCLPSCLAARPPAVPPACPPVACLPASMHHLQHDTRISPRCPF